MSEFAALTESLEGGVVQVRVAGEADLHTAPALREALAQAVASGAPGILVDLSETTFIDSTTLGVLMASARKVRARGGEIAVVCHDPNIRKIFEITLLDRVFPLYASPAAGLAHLQAARDDRGRTR